MKQRDKKIRAQVIIEYFIVITALVAAMLAGLLGLRNGVVNGMNRVKTEVNDDFVRRTTPPDTAQNNPEVEYAPAWDNTFENEQQEVTVDNSYCYGSDCPELQVPIVPETTE
ncbi:MAG: hypothetical protein PHV17_07075 [Candidatus Omnitrophica bacterium]|nr:hypothetical protein [Candidatus Omnitrophota bacterium]